VGAGFTGGEKGAQRFVVDKVGVVDFNVSVNSKQEDLSFSHPVGEVSWYNIKRFI